MEGFPRIVLVWAAALCVACATGGAPLLAELETAAPELHRPVWPAPPAEARVEYLGAIEAEGGFAPRRSIWRRVASLVTGRAELRFVRPAALCVSGSRLAVADPGAARVHRLDLESRRWTELTHAGRQPLQSPVGIACLPDGSVVASDSALEAVWIFDPEGRLPRRIGGRLERPTGLAYDALHQRLWVAETLAHRVRAYDLAGRELLRVGSRGSGAEQFNYPTLLAADGRGGVWVTDSLNFRLQHVNREGRIDRTFGEAGDRAGSLARPRGLAIDGSGRILSVDALLDAVQIFGPDGRLLLAFGGRGRGPGRFWLPADVALDDTGHIYVADSYNRRVQIFAYHPPTIR